MPIFYFGGYAADLSSAFLGVLFTLFMYYDAHILNLHLLRGISGSPLVVFSFVPVPKAKN